MYQFEDCWDFGTLAVYPHGHDNGVRIEVEDEEGNFSAVNLSKHSTLELVKCLINLANGER